MSAYAVFLALCLVGLVIRTSYELLKKAGKVNPRSRLVFSFVFVGMILMLTSWLVMCPTDPWRTRLPSLLRWVGLGTSIAGLGIALWGWAQLKGLENIDHLVITGLFSKIRHPMYTGFIFWILGWVVYFGAAASLIAGLAAIANILFWRRLEEEKLALDFGEEYLRYRATTWF